MTRGEIMINNYLNINLNPTVLASTTRVVNTGKVSPMNWTRFTPKMLERDGMVMMVMKVLVMMVMKMMILMKPNLMAMTMAMISPLREGISLADFCLPESFSLSGVFRPAEVAVSISEPPLDLGFWGR
jgi:hypothetical protein